MAKLIIVCDDSTEKYANYLLQLVSAKDDEDGEIVGTKDGSVEATIWNEVQYEDNKPKLSSKAYVLFMGDSKLARARRETMTERYHEVGMHYGWLGSQAFLYVDDKSLNADNYEDFKEICEKYGKEFKKDLDLRFSPSRFDEKVEDKGEVAKEAAIVAAAAAAPLPFLVAAGISKAVREGVGAVADMAIMAVDKGSDSFKAKDALDHQYNLATLVMYMDGLSEFLGL